MSWTARRERGGALLPWLMLWIMRNLGWSAGQLLLYPITAWFYVTSAGARAASREYLCQVLGRPARQRDVIRHLFTFACVILDRVFFLAGRTADYEITVQGLEAITRLADAGSGCVLLGSHLGSFDVLRAFGRNAPVRVRPVMFRGNMGYVSGLLEALDPELRRDVIEIGSPGAMLQVRECVERGEIVGFLADRTPFPGRMVVARFLGRNTEFPSGPLVVASAVGAPVVLFYGVRTAPRRYLIRFEDFAERIELPRGRRDAALQRWIDAYSERLAAACLAYPFNWFNFYPFWKPSDG
ncbi:MAG: acyltransferase [Acetobacteraceae bacterium]